MSDSIYESEVPVEWRIMRKFPSYEISSQMKIRNRKTGFMIPLDTFGDGTKAVLVKHPSYAPIAIHVSEHFRDAFPSLSHLVK